MTAVEVSPALTMLQQLQVMALFGMRALSRETAVGLSDLRHRSRFANANVLRALEKKGLLGRRDTLGGLVGVRAHALWLSPAGVAAAEALAANGFEVPTWWR